MDEYMTKSGFPDSSCFLILALDRRHEVAEVDVVIINSEWAVSYTHLTLPTN